MEWSGQRSPRHHVGAEPKHGQRSRACGNLGCGHTGSASPGRLTDDLPGVHGRGLRVSSDAQRSHGISADDGRTGGVGDSSNRGGKRPAPHYFGHPVWMQVKIDLDPCIYMYFVCLLAHVKMCVICQSAQNSSKGCLTYSCFPYYKARV